MAVWMALLALALLGCGEEPEPGRVLEPAECEARGGTVIGDPGDGSVHRDGCPEGQELLGSVNLGIEGGICCRE